MLKSERVDVGRVKRLKMWVSVPDGLTTSQVARVMALAIHANADMHAISVFVLRDGERPGLWPYTVGVCDWAPHGDWSRSREGLRDPLRETYTVDTDLRERYFSGVPRPTLYGLSAREVAEIASEWFAEANYEEAVVFESSKTPVRNMRDIAEKRATATVAARRKLTAAQVREIFSAYNSDALRCVNPRMND
jgi:hypothetical protein